MYPGGGSRPDCLPCQTSASAQASSRAASFWPVSFLSAPTRASSSSRLLANLTRSMSGAMRRLSADFSARRMAAISDAGSMPGRRSSSSLEILWIRLRRAQGSGGEDENRGQGETGQCAYAACRWNASKKTSHRGPMDCIRVGRGKSYFHLNASEVRLGACPSIQNPAGSTTIYCSFENAEYYI